MTIKKKSTALAVCKAQDLLPENSSFDELVENLEEMDEIDFPRIRFKQGKFYLTNDQDDKGVEEFDGVIFFYGRQNTFWEGPYDPKNILLPECFSVDGKLGSKPRNSKNEFGDCRSCENNKFGSGTGKGKACRNQSKLYIQQPGTTIPSTLFLAPTSLGSFNKQYLINKVTQKGLAYWKIVTRFKSYQQNDETFFRMQFDVVGIYKDEEIDELKKIRNFWLPAIKNNRTRLDSSVSSSEEQPVEDTSTNRVVKPREPAPVSSGFDEEEEPPF